jgi:hypothetical protein
MRLWSLHPKYLDQKGLTAVWREGLLAQKVLLGETRGYRNHPQLARFREAHDPVAAIGAYLREIVREARRRGYHFDSARIANPAGQEKIPVTEGQVAFEWNHLLSKLRRRSPADYQRNLAVGDPEPHPLFTLVTGEIEQWERGISAKED